MAGISSKAAGGVENKFKYNGIEENTDFDLNMYDAFYRNLDPQIGRFWQVDPAIEATDMWSPYVSMFDNPVSNSDPLGDLPDDGGVKPYQGGIQVFEVADYKGAVPYGQSHSNEQFTVGSYTIVSNYVTGENGKEVFSHYTAHVMVTDPADMQHQVSRVDYVFGKADLQTFKDNVDLLSGAANLMYGGKTKLDDWQVKMLAGESFTSWAGGFLASQWTDPAQLVAAATIAAGGVARETPRPTEAYNRTKHYGGTPTKADRKAFGATSNDVVDHTTPLVQHYYDGSVGSKPGYQMTEAQRKKYASDRSNMQLQPKSQSNSQGGKMSNYSKQQKKKYNL